MYNDLILNSSLTSLSDILTPPVSEWRSNFHTEIKTDDYVNPRTARKYAKKSRNFIGRRSSASFFHAEALNDCSTRHAPDKLWLICAPDKLWLICAI